MLYKQKTLQGNSYLHNAKDINKMDIGMAIKTNHYDISDDNEWVNLDKFFVPKIVIDEVMQQKIIRFFTDPTLGVWV